MSHPIELVTQRLEPFRIRADGERRWRACCPAHAGGNSTALSVRLGDNDAVLLHCFAGCDVERITQSLGLELSDLFPPTDSMRSAPTRRPRLLSATQALELLRSESNLVWVAAHNLANGHALAAADLVRLDQCANRIEYIAREAAR